MSKFKRVDAKLNSLLATVLVYSYDIIGGSLFLNQTGILLATDLDRKMAGRLMTCIALFMNFIFMKFLGESTGTSLLTGLNCL